MTWTQGWLPEQPTLIEIANMIDVVADDARLGEVFHPDRFNAEVRMNKTQGWLPEQPKDRLN